MPAWLTPRAAFALALTAAVAFTGCWRRVPAPPRPAVEASDEPGPPGRTSDRYRCEWLLSGLTMRAGETTTISVSIRNAGGREWPDARSVGVREGREHPVRLSYRFWREDVHSEPGEYRPRFDFPRSVLPGEGLTLDVPVVAPEAPGEYSLQLDLVEEDVTWFEPKGAERLVLRVRVLPP